MPDPEFPDRFFEREDESADSLFYGEPRFVAHIDDDTISALTAYYREFLPPGSPGKPRRGGRRVANATLCH